MSITQRLVPQRALAPDPREPEAVMAAGLPRSGTSNHDTGSGEGACITLDILRPTARPPDAEADAGVDTGAETDAETASANSALQPGRSRHIEAEEPATASSEPPEPLLGPAPTEPEAEAPLPVVPNLLPVKWEGRLGRLILLARSRGGMGATSVAANLALALARRRGLFGTGATRRVALVDLDIQFGTAGNLLDIEDRDGLLALARMTDEPDSRAVKTALINHASGVNVLPAPKKAIPLDALDGTRVASIIDPLLNDHDFVIVDLPHALVHWLEPLLVRAFRLLMVTDLAVPSVVTARRVIDLMREDNPELQAEIVVARERKPLYQGKLQREAAAALGLPLIHWLPEEVKLSRKAFDRGEPLVELSPRCPWSRALRKLARHIEAADAADNHKNKG